MRGGDNILGYPAWRGIAVFVDSLFASTWACAGQVGLHPSGGLSQHHTRVRLSAPCATAVEAFVQPQSGQLGSSWLAKLLNSVCQSAQT